MNKELLKNTVAHLMSPGKGILAADETPSNIGKKFAALHIENTPENRQKYREMLFTTLGMEEYISGVILQDETIYQRTKDGVSFPEYLKDKNILSGIKVDLGLEPISEGSQETITKGLDGLGERLEKYKKYSAKFAKWRSVIYIDSETCLPTEKAMQLNAKGLADYAYTCQLHDIVPIVEPEVLMDGNHSIETSYKVTSDILDKLFKALVEKGVFLEGVLLKPNMVIPGLMCANQVDPGIVANKTIQCFRENVPAETSGIVFLSGGQRDDLSIKHLALMNQHNDLPWKLSFSYGRALQRQALTAWKGQDQNLQAAQKAFLEQARLNSLATLGQIY
ncbi:MAG: fructose-bisphosphate aldolase class I [Candidatus Paracaedibacteraceae bacterium]|nr:fructose-bisphosphate aldolase class I [Candidatus Paracaedibacteraceae bacterium]